MAEIMVPLENTDYSAADAQLWFATRTSGVYTNGHLAVESAGGMAITVGKGIAWLAHDEFGGVAYGNTLDIRKTIEIADAAYPRIDRVVVRLDKVANTGQIAIKKGTPASSPMPPAISRDTSAYEISLAQIRIGAGATEVTGADITDERLDASVCGLMSDGVTHIDTDVIQSQFLSALEHLTQSADDTVQQVEDDAAARLQQVQSDADAIIALIRDAYENAIDGTLAGDLQAEVAQKADKSQSAVLTVAASAWTGEEAPYTAAIPCDVTGARYLVGPYGGGNDAAQRAAIAGAMITATGLDGGLLTLTADGAKPEVDIMILVLGVN